MSHLFCIFNVICFILIQMMMFNEAKNYSQRLINSTNHESLRLSGRHKRSLYDQMPRQLTVRVKFPTGEEANLNWKLSKSYVANEHLPVIALLADYHLNMMHDFGEFVAYHDEIQCSAVVYFAKFNAFYGVIGLDYYIEALPYAFDENGVYQLGTVGEPFIRQNSFPFHHIHPSEVIPPLSDSESWFNFLESLDSRTDYNRKRHSDCHENSSSEPKRKQSISDPDIQGETSNSDKRRKITVGSHQWHRQNSQIYLEVLIFITQDIVDEFKQYFGEDYFHWLIRYHIIYFNAIDMMFKSLQNDYTGIRINIAKIVIEDALLLPFTFISDTDDIEFSKMVEKLPQFLQEHQHEFEPDSFDHVFIHTRRIIADSLITVDGLSRYSGDLYSARKFDQFYDVVPITVVQFQSAYVNYVVAVHEIARTFDLKIEPSTKSVGKEGLCESIMQREGPKCKNCLTWSNDSVEQLEIFRRRNKNICFFLNTPRSLRPPGPSMFLRPHRQCQCFGYNSYRTGADKRPLSMIRVNDCSTPLMCKAFDKSLYLEPTVKPFDGTPCAKKKVCWNGRCVEIWEAYARN